MMETAEQLKAKILSSESDPEDEGAMGANSLGGYLAEEEEEVRTSPGHQEIPEPEEFEDDELARTVNAYHQRREETALAQMTSAQRSAYAQLKRLNQQQTVSDYVGRFAEDMAETGSELSEFPAVSSEFYRDLRFGRAKTLSDERAAVSSSPPLEMLSDWIAKNPSRVLELLKKENPSEPSHLRLKKLINTIRDAPAVGTRFRDKAFGYDRPQERPMTDEEIRAFVNGYFEEK